MQKTLLSDVVIKGVGLHSGQPAMIRMKPAAVESGIWFQRTDVRTADNFIPARWDAAQHSALCTKLINDDGVTVSTVEHLMAGLAGCGITNALIEIDGPEVPILDGSAREFVQAILSVGCIEQSAPVRSVRVLKTVRVENGDAYAEFTPDDVMGIEFEIDFADAAIGQQQKSITLSNGAFIHHLCDSRTFCRNSDVTTMRQNGLALGGTLKNAIVVDGAKILSPGGLRHKDEPVRHKMLDAMGDLALAGAPILARYHGYKAGHTLTNRLLHALFNDPTAYEYVTCDAKMASRLPGADISVLDIPTVA